MIGLLALGLAGCGERIPSPPDCPGCGEIIVPPPDRYR
jgi:hypothetical protein